jgi:hypothetical protein
MEIFQKFAIWDATRVACGGGYSNSCFLEIAGVRLWKTAVLSMRRDNYPIRNQDFLY